MITAQDKHSRIVGLKIIMREPKVMLKNLRRAQQFEKGGEEVEVVENIFI